MAEYVFKNVTQVGEKEYQTVIDGQELAEMWRDGVITYNPEIQRGTKVKRGKDNTETEVAVYSKANVKKIYESMLSGQYFTDMITLNILEDGSEKVELDDAGNLTVTGFWRESKSVRILMFLNAKIPNAPSIYPTSKDLVPRNVIAI